MFNAYVMHYSKLAERKDHIQNELNKKDISNYEFIGSFDKEELTNEIKKQYYDNNISEARRKANITISRNGGGEYDSPELSDASISLCIKHMVAMNKLVESEYEYGLMLEDDCYFYDSRSSISQIINNAPSDWDVIFVGGTFDHNICNPITAYGNYLLSGHPSTNTTSSFLITKQAAKKTLEKMQKFSLPIDWELNHNFHENCFNVYHIYPYIATQISGTIFKGTVQR